MFKIIQKRKIWFSFSGLLAGLSIIALFAWGLNFGIDFTGGSLLEVEFKEGRPPLTKIYEGLSDQELSSLVAQPTGETGLILRFQQTSEDTHQDVLTVLERLAEETAEIPEEATGQEKEVQADYLTELRFESVGPSIGQELRTQAMYAIIVVLLAIIAYIAWAFRRVSKPVASWKYGIASIIALFHDVIIVLGIFSVLGEFYNVEINSAFVAAILTVLGYSVNDTIVVFDRIRENLPKSDKDFESTVNDSVNQTIVRSINTSTTTLLVLLAIIIFGGSTIKDFALALFFGVALGTYSSIFLASPLLVWFERIKK